MLSTSGKHPAAGDMDQQPSFAWFARKLLVGEQQLRTKLVGAGVENNAMTTLATKPVLLFPKPYRHSPWPSLLRAVA